MHFIQTLPSDIPSFVYDDPRLLAALTIIVVALVHWQAGLTYSEYMLAHRLKCYIFAILDPVATRHGRPLVAVKGPRDDLEFVTTLDVAPRAVARQLRKTFDPHLIATAKGREFVGSDGKQFQWAHSQWVTFYSRDEIEYQTEVYLFPNEDATTDVYVHVERPVTDPEGHTEGMQLPGDAHGKFTDVYDSALSEPNSGP